MWGAQVSTCLDCFFFYVCAGSLTAPLGLLDHVVSRPACSSGFDWDVTVHEAFYWETTEAVKKGMTLNWELFIPSFSVSASGCRVPSCLLGWRQRGHRLLHWRNSMSTLTTSFTITITSISLPATVRLTPTLNAECSLTSFRKSVLAWIWITSCMFQFNILKWFLWQVIQ